MVSSGSKRRNSKYAVSGDYLVNICEYLHQNLKKNECSFWNVKCVEKLKECFFFLWWGSTCLHRMRKSPIDLLKQGVSGSDGTYSPWKLELHIATTSDLRIWWSRCLLKDLDWCKKQPAYLFV